MVLLGFFHEFINLKPGLAFSHYKAGADAGYLDAVYYYIHYLLRTRHDLKKEDIATRKALYYCEKLNDRLHDGADWLMQEIRHRNWQGESSHFRPATFDFLQRVVLTLSLQIQSSFAPLKPTKVPVGSTRLPDEFQRVLTQLQLKCSASDPIVYFIEAEFWLW